MVKTSVLLPFKFDKLQDDIRLKNIKLVRVYRKRHQIDIFIANNLPIFRIIFDIVSNRRQQIQAIFNLKNFTGLTFWIFLLFNKVKFWLRKHFFIAMSQLKYRVIKRPQITLIVAMGPRPLIVVKSLCKNIGSKQRSHFDAFGDDGWDVFQE